MAETYTIFVAASNIHALEDARVHRELCAEEDIGDGGVIRAALNSIVRA